MNRCDLVGSPFAFALAFTFAFLVSAELDAAIVLAVRLHVAVAANVIARAIITFSATRGGIEVSTDILRSIALSR